jgi:nucleotide-binding universal stress UspA family protein
MEVDMNPRILVATDATSSTTGALRLALNLARRTGADVDALLVAEPADARVAATEVDHDAPDRAVAWSEPVRARLHRQLAALGPETAAWTKLIGFGAAGPGIARIAAERDASLILLGLRRGAHYRDPLRGKTTMRVVHSCAVPVLAVHPNAIGLPHRILAAVDFDHSSLGAARALLPLLGGRASLHLVHVALQVGPAEAGMLRQWETTYMTGAATRLEELARDLEESRRISVGTHVAAGDPEEKLLELADTLDADVITVGSHDDFLRRGGSGSLALALIRSAPCSVLVAPAEVDRVDSPARALAFAGQACITAPVGETRRSEEPCGLTPLPSYHHVPPQSMCRRDDGDPAVDPAGRRPCELLGR